MPNSILTDDFQAILSRITPSFNQLAGQELLITGAMGFVGSYLMDFMAYANEYYLARPCKVIGVDNRVAASRMPRVGPHMAMTPNVMDYRVDYCIHAASIASPKLYLANPKATIEANVYLTRRLLEWSTQASALLYISTSEVYGDTANVPTPETEWGHASFANDRAVYHESKRFAETLCHIAHKVDGVPVKIARPFYIFGPGESLDDGRLVPQLIKAALTGEPFTIYGSGAATRTLCYISDAVEQLFAVLLDGKAGEAYNVGNWLNEISVGELANIAKDMFPSLRIEYVKTHETMIDAPDRRLPDTRKVRAISAAPQVGLVEGLRRTYRYYAEKHD